MNDCLELVKSVPLSIERQLLMKCLQKLSLAKCRQVIGNGFLSEELRDMINLISSR